MVRADKHNGIDWRMFVALNDAVDELRASAGVRAVVLSGDGPSFCAGLDFQSFASGDGDLAGDGFARAEGEIANYAQRVAYGWRQLEVPVIAALQGACFGGGLQIALGADVRIAAPDAKLSVREIRWGLVPDMGITATLPRLLRIDVAKELTYTGRTVSGEEAAALGLVTRTSDDPLGAAQALAREIAARSPDAVQAAKRLFDTAWNAPVDEGLVLETELQMSLIGGTNQMAAVTSGPDPDPEVFTDAL
jgi:enoyl-CoA hydratase/carnithine racemase